MRTTYQFLEMHALLLVGMKPLSERDENPVSLVHFTVTLEPVGMKPLSERDENKSMLAETHQAPTGSRNEATL